MALCSCETNDYPADLNGLTPFVIMMLRGISVDVRRQRKRLRLTDRPDSYGKVLRLLSKKDFDRQVNEFLAAKIELADVVLKVGSTRIALPRLLSGRLGRHGLMGAIKPD